MSKLYYKYGPMESAKSALLLMEAYSFESRGIDVICMKPSIDDRDGAINKIKSRVGLEKECIIIYPDYDIFEIIKNILNSGRRIQWVLVDESQFLTAYQIEELRAVVDTFDINVMCYGLRTDFQTKLFEGSKRLFELADDIEEMKISCACGRKAIVNARFNQNGDIVINGEQILIGGEDIYKPLCSKCYKEEIKKIKM